MLRCFDALLSSDATGKRVFDESVRQHCRFLSTLLGHGQLSQPELSVGWVDPWIGLGWVGSGFFSFCWVGLGPL